MFHNRFADRKSQAGSLFKSIYFIKTVEYIFLAFLRNPRPSIFHKDIHKVCIDWVNCITKMNIPFFGKFTSIVNKVTYDLFQTCSICVNIDIFIGKWCSDLYFGYRFHSLFFLYIHHERLKRTVSKSKFNGIWFNLG